MIRVSVAIMAHRKRKPFVAELLAKLDRPATVIWDSKNDRWDTGRRSMLAFEPDATHHLVLQDDAIIPYDLVAGVEAALAYVPTKTPLCLYTGRTRPYRGLVQQLVSRAGRRTRWLTMADLHWGVGIVMPTELIEPMIQWGDGRPDIANYDRRIGRWLMHQGIGTWYPWPSLVDHRDSPSLVPGRGSANRRAHWFIGATASALEQQWDGAVVSIPALSNPDSPAPGQIGASVRFVSQKYPELHIPTVGVRFRKGVAEVTRRSAIAYLNSPWMRRRGVMLASEAEPQPTPTPAVEAAPAVPDELQVRMGDGELGASREAESADSAQPPTAEPAEDTSPPAAESAKADEPTGDSAVPDGTAAVVLAWVGTDRGRARQALEAEQARSKPRASLIAKLTPLAKRRVVAGSATAAMPALTADNTEGGP